MPRTRLSRKEVSTFRTKATDAAMHLFARHGYEGVTMRAVAAALGCSAMTPYRYFAGKQELFDMVRAEAFRRFADRLEASLVPSGVDPIERLRNLKRAYIRFALDQPDAYRIMFELQQPRIIIYKGLIHQSGRAFGCLHRTVVEAVAAGRLEGDPLTIAHILWANTHGLVSLHLAGKLTLGRSISRLAAIDHEFAGARREP